MLMSRMASAGGAHGERGARRGGVGERLDREAVAAEVLDEQRAQLGLVVDDQQLRAGCCLDHLLLAPGDRAAVYRRLRRSSRSGGDRMRFVCRGAGRPVKQMKRGAPPPEAAPIPPAAKMAAIDAAGQSSRSTGSARSGAASHPRCEEKNFAMTNKNAPVDKARQQAMAKVDAVMKQVDESFKILGADRDASVTAEVKAFKAKVEAAAKDPSPAATKALLGLAKTGEALVKTLAKSISETFWHFRRIELKASVNAALAGALLDIGKLGDPSLAKMMFAEQSALRARMDKAEKTKSDVAAGEAMDEIDGEMEGLQERLKSALAVSKWLGSGFKSMLALAESAIGSVPSQRLRTVLRAELDFVDQAKTGALAKLDVKAIQNATLPALRRLQKVATRLSADGSALDRELVRVGKLIKDAGAPAELAARLKKLAQEKAAGWPQIRDFDSIEKALDAFEKSVADLALAAQKPAVATAR
jgi:hypothetical protein